MQKPGVFALVAIAVLILFADFANATTPATRPAVVDPSSLHGKVLCGYQGWFRCPGDPTDMGWIHWSRDRKKITPQSLTFEMWPDMSEYGPGERYAVDGFTYPDGKQAELFSSDNGDTVLRHFTWMRDYGIDGVWLQQFAVELPGGPGQRLYPSRERIINHVRSAAAKTGRVWALTYDLSGMPADKAYDAITNHWKSMIDGKLVDDRYVRQDGLPVVEIWGLYPGKPQYPLTTPEAANKLLDFFADGPYAAKVVGGGDWNWRKTFSPQWKQAIGRMHAWMPWNVGNHAKDADGTKRASTAHWAADKAECEALGAVWIPVVYPGFSWENLQQGRGGGNNFIPRRRGDFLREQFDIVATVQPRSVFVAMFDEVDEATAIFKVTNNPPVQAKFVGYEGLPSDTYLKITGEGTAQYRKAGQ